MVHGGTHEVRVTEALSERQEMDTGKAGEVGRTQIVKFKPEKSFKKESDMLRIIKERKEPQRKEKPRGLI